MGISVSTSFSKSPGRDQSKGKGKLTHDRLLSRLHVDAFFGRERGRFHGVAPILVSCFKTSSEQLTSSRTEPRGEVVLAEEVCGR